MDVKKFENFSTSEIVKVENFTLEDLKNYDNNEGEREPLGNAHHYMVKFLDRTNEINKRNPFHIKKEQMFKAFGSPNLQDDYKGSDIWILDYKNNRFYVDIHSMEGTSVGMFFDGEVDSTDDIQGIIRKYAPGGTNRVYDKQFSIDAEEFVDELYDTFI